MAAMALLWLFVLATLAPGVSRAMAGRAASADAAPWSQLCQGGAPAPGDPAEPLRHALEHCPLCALQSHGSAPAQAAAALPLCVAGHAAPYDHGAHAAPTTAIRAAQARAPPRA